ncbi:MAG: preprotein translocase subunit SecG [Candidatus Omnitrophica bacterium]|nr:preprotein translocase subunit SecG [Candidatus Omnitrophota bacterium]
MMALAVTFHVLVCIILIAIILVQRGRGGGFVEAFSGLESMLGTKTSTFLSKLTSVLAVLFFLSCLNLAFLSLRESRSLMRSVKPQKIITTQNATDVQPQRTEKPQSSVPTTTTGNVTQGNQEINATKTATSSPGNPMKANQQVPNQN